MQKLTLVALSVITATALAFVVGPALIQSAAAVPAPKTVEQCSEDKFQDRETCPGKSADSGGRAGDERDNECIARNNGQAKQNDCVETDIVNP
jgi:hypothetical protein